jgi:hypothetical protein
MSNLSVDQIVSKFLNKAEHHENTGAKSAAMSIRDGVLYSYRTAMARWEGNTVIVNKARYSNTTSKQMTRLYRFMYTLGITHIDVWDLDSSKYNHEMWLAELDNQYDSLKSARKDHHTPANMILTVMDSMRAYKNLTQATWELPPMPDLTDSDKLMRKMLEALIKGEINDAPWSTLLTAYDHDDTTPLTDMITKWGEKYGNTKTRAKPQP